MGRTIFNHNDIICETRNQAIELAKSFPLAPNEPVSIRYQSYKEVDRDGVIVNQPCIRVIIGIGTGDSKDPVEVINDIEDKIVINSYERGVAQPTNTGKLWIDTNKVFDFNNPAEGSNLEKILKMINRINNRLDLIEFAFQYGLSPGTTSHYAGKELADFRFTGTTPMTYSELVDYLADDENVDDYTGITKMIDSSDGSPENWVNKIFPNITHIAVKHDTLANMEKYVPRDYEFIWCDDNPGLYIGIKGKYVLVTGVSGKTIDPGGGEEVDPDDFEGKIMEYIDFKTEDENITVRLRMNADGTSKAYDAREDDETYAQSPTTLGSANKGLVISMVYAGNAGAGGTTYGYCSHSFVELYNESGRDINLRGLSLQVAGRGSDWTVIPLKGILHDKHCFLVRFARCSVDTAYTNLVVIDKYDIDCPDIALSNSALKVYLTVGTEPFTGQNPWSSTTSDIPSGYIDLFASGRRLKSNERTSTEFTADANEGGTSVALLQDSIGAVRNNLADAILNVKATAGDKLGDTNNSVYDWISFDYARSLMVDDPTVVFKPWCRADGPKSMYFDRTGFSNEAPDMVGFSIGAKPSTRTFNWVSTDKQAQYVYLRKVGEAAWKTYQSGTEVNNIYTHHPNGQNTITHKVIVRDLTAGTYNYKVGRPGFMSEEYTMVIKERGLDPTASFNFAQVTDQQGWTFSEYEPWRHAAKEVMRITNKSSNVFPVDDEGIDFLVNTGDMSQNGTRPAEWLDYYKAGGFLANVAQMNTVGNNDLCPDPSGSSTSLKVLSTSFVYYHNYELDPDNPQIDSNGNLMRSVYAFDYGCAHFVVLNSNEWFEEQKTWFRAHMAKLNSDISAGNRTAPAWKIAIIHDSPICLTTSNEDPGANASAPGAGGRRDSGINTVSNSDVNKRFEWSRLLSEYGFEMMLSGHKHTYSRTHLVKEKTEGGPFTYGSGSSAVTIPVDYLNPLVDKGTDDADGVTHRYTSKAGYFINVMCQATGFKLKSNKDIPAQNINWLGKYFPGVNSGTSTELSVNGGQQYPIYTHWQVTPTQITMTAYKVNNVCHGGKIYDPFPRGTSEQGGCNAKNFVTDLSNVGSEVIDRVILSKS